MPVAHFSSRARGGSWAQKNPPCFSTSSPDPPNIRPVCRVQVNQVLCTKLLHTFPIRRPRPLVLIRTSFPTSHNLSPKVHLLLTDAPNVRRNLKGCFKEPKASTFSAPFCTSVTAAGRKWECSTEMCFRGIKPASKRSRAAGAGTLLLRLPAHTGGRCSTRRRRCEGGRLRRSRVRIRAPSGHIQGFFTPRRFC